MIKSEAEKKGSLVREAFETETYKYHVTRRQKKQKLRPNHHSTSMRSHTVSYSLDMCTCDQSDSKEPFPACGTTEKLGLECVCAFDNRPADCDIFE